jgi:trans-2,3-dihydro-3-hydroxyanthranilate isomerase
MARRVPFVWVDVFARNPLEGNQLAVFPDARGLTSEEMHGIARETHLSETTFVLPAGEPHDLDRGFRTRIFAVAGEMPFAGHPTLGTAFVLNETRQREEIALELQVGRIPVRFSAREGLPFGEMRQNDPLVGATHDPSAVARTLGIAPEELDPRLPVQTVSTGNAFAIVPFRSLSTLAGMRPNLSGMDEYLAGTDARFFYLVSTETVDRSAALHARMLFQGGEDPATGSAAGPAIAWMVLHGLARPGEEVLIEQGLEVHRPSRIYGRAQLREGRVTDVRVGGHCVPVVRGELDL